MNSELGPEFGVPRIIEVDPAAARRLTNWGAEALVPVLADKLLRDCSYGGLVPRMRQQLRHQAFLTTTDKGNEEALLPYWYNVGLGYGQCSELSGQLMHNQVFLSAVEDVNAQLLASGEGRVVAYECWGQTERFFTTPPSQHVWVGLLHDDEGPDAMVNVDVAFGTISVGRHRMEDYRMRREWTMPLTGSFGVVGSSEMEDKGELRRASRVMGLSADGQRVAMVGFWRERGEVGNGEGVRMYALLKDEQGKYEVMLRPREGRWWNLDGRGYTQEASELVALGNQLQWNTDMGKFPYALHGLEDLRVTVRSEG